MNISNKAKKKNDLQQSEIINKNKFQIKACEQKNKNKNNEDV